MPVLTIIRPNPLPERLSSLRRFLFLGLSPRLTVPRNLGIKSLRPITRVGPTFCGTPAPTLLERFFRRSTPLKATKSFNLESLCSFKRPDANTTSMPPYRSLPRCGVRSAQAGKHLLLLVTFAAPALAQSIPPTISTQPVATISPTSAPQPTHRAHVDYTAGKLVVTAENSSLNLILRDISRLTGMTVTGGVVEERVFGTYGPGDISSILAQLLNGTGSNMLVIENALQSPKELVLTPRQGGPTPPGPSSAQYAGEEADLPPQLTPRLLHNYGPGTAAMPNTPSSPLPASSALTSLPSTSGAPLTQPTATANPTNTPIPPPTNATTQQSPNGVKTPQQIYDQLMQLQQQQPKGPQ